MYPFDFFSNFPQKSIVRPTTRWPFGISYWNFIGMYIRLDHVSRIITVAFNVWVMAFWFMLILFVHSITHSEISQDYVGTG